MPDPVNTDAIQVLSSGLALDGSRRFNPRRESRIGEEDGRILVPDPSGLPWRRICQLSFRNGKGIPERGTGWFAGPRTIVTAGHCLWHRNKKGEDGKSRTITITPGRHGKDDDDPDRRFGILKSNRFSAHPKWIDGRGVPFDFGCIHLDEDAAEEIGAFEFASAEDSGLTGACVNVAGYPITAPDGRGTRGTDLYAHNDQVLAMLGTRLFYATDTQPGQSGGPVWVVTEEGAPPTVIGIHAYGEGNAPGEVGEANSATRLTDGFVQLIETWIGSEGEEEAFVPAEVARKAAEVPAVPGTGVSEEDAPGTDADLPEDVRTGLAARRIEHFVRENAPEMAAESGTLDPVLANVSSALDVAIDQVEAMTGRLLRRVRAQQKLDLYASILTLVLTSSLFAAIQIDQALPSGERGVHWGALALGLLTIFSAILALVAKRMGDGGEGLLSRYSDLQVLAFDARMQRATLPVEGVTEQRIEDVVTTISNLTAERHRLEASDFLFRDGGWVMRILGVGNPDAIGGRGRRDPS